MYRQQMMAEDRSISWKHSLYKKFFKQIKGKFVLVHAMMAYWGVEV